MHFHHPLKNINSIVSTIWQLPIVHVSTDWPMKVVWQIFIIWTFLAFQKESQVKSRNDIIYTGFHMQLRSWKLKLQPKIMSYLDKRHVTHYHALSSMIIFSFSLSHTHTLTHTHTNTHILISLQTLITPLMGYLFPFLFFLLSYSVQSTYVGFISICTFKTAWVTLSLKELIRCD